MIVLKYMIVLIIRNVLPQRNVRYNHCHLLHYLLEFLHAVHQVALRVAQVAQVALRVAQVVHQVVHQVALRVVQVVHQVVHVSNYFG